MCHFEIENTQWLTTMPSHHTPPRACKSTLQLPVQCWSHFAFSNSRKKVWHGVVWGCSIDQASSLVVNKPEGDAFSILHILVEVFLPVSAEYICTVTEKFPHEPTCSPAAAGWWGRPTYAQWNLQKCNPFLGTLSTSQSQWPFPVPQSSLQTC